MSYRDRTVAATEPGRREWRVLIGGRLQGSSEGRRYTTYNPATEEPIAEVPDCGPDDVDMAVEAAEAASAQWRQVPIRERSRVIRALAAVLRTHREELAFLDAIDGGSPISAMRFDVDQACDYMEAMADLALGLTGDTIGASSSHLHYTVLEPYGVVARINPYNHPLLFSAAKSAAPLLAGNAVVVKVPEQTPLSPLRMAELFADLLPAGCLNVLTGHSPELGRALVRHPRVRRIGFTGSDRTGRAIQQEAASVAVKHVTLELGGKNAMIALPDMEPEQIGENVVRAMNLFPSAGQSCGSTSRVLVPAAMVEKVAGYMRAAFERLVVGDPIEDSTQMGPLVSADQYRKVCDYIAIASGEGASLVTGGGRPENLHDDKGFFLAPTIFTDVTPDMRIATEEVFGPVVSLMGYSTEDDAVEIANSVNYGLTASIWTNDLRAANRLTRRVEAGYVWVNDSAAHFFGTPFGGYKDSGVGREESIEELRGYCLTKSVHIAVDEQPDAG